ncbi:ADP-ribosylglycohydrolase family protein [Vibrio sp. 99-70-13A1]|uniref:ADP-ribosylglycohydrolase family protein n=1 Tax=Vibrio sp. 99-70-13A1 TaxID=2607601 RepID=UPI00149337F4|nr:ADP-ribosylglycohydrolase family protein [Vibrio sp. 99-70-13A1]NOH98863.1 ADP-ribosylglycohydrolase family protein [Vibrio sp. 99-70-13A1]
MDQHKEKAYHAVVGALVGDVASMGLHWLYDQQQIIKVAGNHPEFHAPDRFDYQDKGFFAHEGKSVGDHSQYGAQVLAMVDALTCAKAYSEKCYIEHFREWFDFGGYWVGYIDKPTKITLQNIHQLEANGLPVTQCGADDTQLPAISKLIPLIACFHTSNELPAMVESAVRVTNNNDKAVEWAQALTLLLQAAIQGHTPMQCVEMVRQTCSSFIHEQVNLALAEPELSITEAAQKFGLHCDLAAAFPVIIRIVATAKNYEQGIRDNILCGGDNCGRSIIIGAVLAASYFDDDRSMPCEWLARLNLNGSVLALPIQ